VELAHRQLEERLSQQPATDRADPLAQQDWDEILARRGAPTTHTVGSAAVAAVGVAVTAVTAVPMSLPIVGPIVKRIRHKAPDQRVMIINESPEDSCTYDYARFLTRYSRGPIFRTS